MNKFVFIFLLLPVFFFCQEERDSIVLDTVLHIYLNKQFSAGHILEKYDLENPKFNSYTFLGQALQNNSSISFREQTYGNISSISFRGLSPSHTGIYFEGIPINSSFLGQLDFNSLSVNSFSDLKFRKGGGSALYGSGAVGGSFFLNRKLQYNQGFGAQIKQMLGSFGQSISAVDLDYSDQKIAIKLSGNYNSSENDYLINNGVEFVPQENAAYSLWTGNLDVGYKLDRKNDFKLSFWSNNNGFREFPGNRFSPQNSRLENAQQVTSVKWNHKQKNLLLFTQLAHLGEKFVYQPNQNQDKQFISKANSYFARADALVDGLGKYNLRLGSVTNYITGEGDNYPNSGVERMDNLYYLSISRKLNKANASLNINKGISSSQFTIPFTFDLGLDYDLNSKHQLKASINTNQRTPTLNDLFYQPGGNPNIEAERGWSAEISHVFNSNKAFRSSITGYYGEFSNWIQWEPNDFWVFSPINFNKVNNYGAEAFVEYQKKIGRLEMVWNANYAFTRSMDMENQKQRRYVPFHKANQSLQLIHKSFEFQYNWLFNGDSYIDAFELESIEGFQLHNLVFLYKLHTKATDVNLHIAINNILDESYETLRFNPMPGRNYLMGLKLKL